MKPNTFRDVDTADLNNQARETEEQLFRLRFQISMGQSDGVKRYRELRKDRARMLGVLRERELEAIKTGAVAQTAPKSEAKSGNGKSGSGKKKSK